MKNAKWLLVAMVVIVGGLAVVTIAKRQAARGVASNAGKAGAALALAGRDYQSTASPVTHDVVPQEATAAPPPEHPQPLKPIMASGQTNINPQKAVAQANQG